MAVEGMRRQRDKINPCFGNTGLRANSKDIGVGDIKMQQRATTNTFGQKPTKLYSCSAYLVARHESIKELTRKTNSDISTGCFFIFLLKQQSPIDSFQRAQPFSRNHQAADQTLDAWHLKRLEMIYHP